MHMISKKDLNSADMDPYLVPKILVIRLQQITRSSVTIASLETIIDMHW